jgi:hypothetical protein
MAHEMSRLMGALQVLTRSGAAVLVVHHTIKRAAEFGSVGGVARGSGAIISSTDGNLILTRDGTHLRLETEMRDAEGETISLDFDGATAAFGPRVAATPEPPTVRYPGGIHPDDVVALAAAGVASDPAGGLTARALGAARGFSDETARQALAALLRDGHLVKAGPANRPIYRPPGCGTPTQPQSS